MATPIVVNPTQPSQVVVNGTQKSGTPIIIDDTIDWARIEVMIEKAVANSGGGSGEGNFIIPEDTYKQPLHGGETAYALSGITTKEITLRIVSPEETTLYNGFAFQTHGNYIQFDVGYKNYAYDYIYMRQQEGDKYHFSSSDESFTKSSKRRFHTFYWTHNQIKCDSKKIMNFGHYSSDSPEGDKLDIHIKSQSEFTIINFSQRCETLYARPTSDKHLYDIIAFKGVDYITVSTVDIRNTQLHFSAFEDNVLPKHQNIFVTNNSIKPAYYANKMYFVRTNKVGSCFDFVGNFNDSVNLILDNEKKLHFHNIDGILMNKIYIYDNSYSIFVTGDLSKQGKEFVIRPEAPPIPMNKKGYIYNNGLIYLGTSVVTKKYRACVYRYRKNKRSKGFRYIKYRKIKGVLEGLKLWGNLYIQSKSKTGVRSVFTSVVKVHYNFCEERLTMVKT